MYQVKLEIISTVMNFLCILQGELSFMFARGVTTTRALWNAREERFFPIDVIIAHSQQHTSACS